MKQYPKHGRRPDLEVKLNSGDTHTSLGTARSQRDSHVAVHKHSPERRTCSGIAPVWNDHELGINRSTAPHNNSVTESSSSTQQFFESQSAVSGRAIYSRQSDNTESSAYEVASTQRNVLTLIDTAQTSNAKHEGPACIRGSVSEELPRDVPSVYTSMKETNFGADSDYVRVVLDNLITMHEKTGQALLVNSVHGNSFLSSHAAGSSSSSVHLQQPSLLSAGMAAERVINLQGMSGEQLLLVCATAIENKNVVIAQHAVSALKKISSTIGEPRERVNAYFLKALLCRAGSLLDPLNPDHLNSCERKWTKRKVSLNELISCIDMTPYYRFGFVAANGALLEAFDGMDRIHILDFSTTHCMQWPTLIDALADRMSGPPHVRLTISSATPPTPAPRLQSSYEVLGNRLARFAWSKGVPFEFQILTQPLEILRATDIELRDGEVLGVNCAFRLRYLADEIEPDQSGSPTVERPSQAYHAAGSPCPRDKFLQVIRCLNPAVVTLYEEDCNTTSSDLVSRLKESYNHEWMPFDILATYPENVNKNRLEHEKDLGKKIENLIACEGYHRIERLESKDQWLFRMRQLQFQALPTSKDVVAALREMLSDHAAEWGLKLDDDDTQLLSWKGHSLAFASSWVLAPPTAV